MFATTLANLLVCALVLMALAALWILSRVFIHWVQDKLWARKWKLSPYYYGHPVFIAKVRKALKDNPVCPVTKEKTCHSITLPWYVWDEIFHNLDKDLGHYLYPENGPLDDVKHLIDSDCKTN